MMGIVEKTLQIKKDFIMKGERILKKKISKPVFNSKRRLFLENGIQKMKKSKNLKRKIIGKKIRINSMLYEISLEPITTEKQEIH